MKFLEIQFNKSLEEAHNNFNKVVKSITELYQNLIKNIKFFCLEQMA